MPESEKRLQLEIVQYTYNTTIFF